MVGPGPLAEHPSGTRARSLSTFAQLRTLKLNSPRSQTLRRSPSAAYAVAHDHVPGLIASRPPRPRLSSPGSSRSRSGSQRSSTTARTRSRSVGPSPTGCRRTAASAAASAVPPCAAYASTSSSGADVLLLPPAAEPKASRGRPPMRRQAGVSRRTRGKIGDRDMGRTGTHAGEGAWEPCRWGKATADPGRRRRRS